MKKLFLLICSSLIASMVYAQVIHVTNGAEFQKYIQDTRTPLVIKFYMTGCPPCARLKPLIDQLSQEFADKVNIIEANVKELPHIANQYGIRTVPTILYFKNGSLVNKRVGVSDYLVYRQEITQLL